MTQSRVEPVTEAGAAPICGTSVLAATDGFRPDQIGCGKSIDEVYRCVQCSVPFHRDCARRHFDWPIAGSGPSRHALDAVLADVDAAAFIANQARADAVAERDRLREALTTIADWNAHTEACVDGTCRCGWTDIEDFARAALNPEDQR